MAGVHEDFGEKIGGAKKDLWKDRGLYADDLEKYEVVKKRQEERRQRQESGNAFRAAGHTDNADFLPRRNSQIKIIK